MITKPQLPWVVRQVEVIRGTATVRIECFPSFHYATAAHTTEIAPLEDMVPNILVQGEGGAANIGSSHHSRTASRSASPMPARPGPAASPAASIQTDSPVRNLPSGQPSATHGTVPSTDYSGSQHTNLGTGAAGTNNAGVRALLEQMAGSFGDLDMSDDDLTGHVGEKRIVFRSDKLTLDLRWIIIAPEGIVPHIQFDVEDRSDVGFKGPGVVSEVTLSEGQGVIFILREVPKVQTGSKRKSRRTSADPLLSKELTDALLKQTLSYWHSWIAQSKCMSSCSSRTNKA